MFNPMDLTGRTILVTGASSGLGRSISLLLSRLGARLILVGRSEPRLEETRDRAEGDQHLVAPRDLGKDLDAIPKWMKGLATESGPLHGLVHSAGMHFMRPLRALSVSRLHELMQVNFSSAVALTKGFRQRGVRGDLGSVVYLSSVMARVGGQGVSAYAASKGALVAMAMSLALELADEGIRVNCLAPGHIASEMAARSEALMTDEQASALHEMHPLGAGRPDDVANAAAFLLADTGRWITGQTLVIDGGYTIH